MSNPEDFWRKTINQMTNSLPDDGKEPPKIEEIPAKKKRINDGSRKVLVQKIITQIYVFTDPSGKMYTTNATQHLHVLGEMTLEQGLKLAQEDSST